MREIQTKIRRDRIENDNRKTELQSKAQGGLKTAKSEEKDPNQPTENTSAISDIVPEKKKDGITFREQSKEEGVIFSEQTEQLQAENIQIPTDIQSDLEQLKDDITLEPTTQQSSPVINAAHSIKGDNASTTAQSETANSTTEKSKIIHQKSTAAEIQSQIKRDSIESSIDRSAIQSRSEGGIKTAKAAETDNISKIKENARTGFVKAKSLQAAKKDKISNIKENARKGFVRAKKLQTAATVGSAAAGIISVVVPKGNGGDLSTESADKVKESAGNITVKSFDAIKSFAENKAKKLKTIEKSGISGKIPHGRIYNLRVNISERITENIKPLKFVRDKTRAIKANTAKAVNSLKVVKTVKRLNAIKVEDLVKASRPVKAIQSLKVVKAVKRLNAIKVEDIIKNSKAIKAFNSFKAVKAVKKLNSIKIGWSHKEAVKDAENIKVLGGATKGVITAVSTVQRFKGLSGSGDFGSDLAEQTKDAAGKTAEKAVQLSKKAVSKISKSEKSIKTTRKSAKSAKRTLQKATKKAVKTSAKAKATAKATENAAKASAKAAAKTAEETAKITAKIVSSIANAIGSLMSTPAGPIILAVILGVVLIVIIFNVISSAIQVPVTVVSGAGSSLGWLFGDDSHSDDDEITDMYYDFEPKAFSAMESARTYYKDEISGISFGERDTLEFNGSSFYPASSADDFIKSYFDNLDYGDYVYLLEICYIKKLRDERAARGLSETDIPEVTISEDDIFSFIIDYCYEFEITIIEGQPCPPRDCQEGEDITWHYGDDCPDVGDDGGTCPGHPYTFNYCDNSHIKAVIVIQPVSRSTIEDVLLALTEDERNMLETGIDLLRNELQP